MISIIRVLCTVAAFILVAGIFITQPVFRENRPSVLKVDEARLKEHVMMLSETFHPRDWTHTENLDRCADYIAKHLKKAGAAVDTQVFEVQGRSYRNVIGRFGSGEGARLIIGAHYDAYEGSPGANDNASGVAALIELAYLIGIESPDREIELVAYSLEEPPFFKTPHMGSAVHAKSIAEEKADIKGVIVLEMVGFFSDEPGSQSYPSLLFRLLYPGRANFAAVVGRMDQGSWIRTVKAGMKGATDLPIYSVRAPAIVPGIDFSDHMNYWPYGINALMITDTAFYRDKAYHTPADTAERLDYIRMGKIVIALFSAISII